MHILIIGAAGMLGRKCAAHLATTGMIGPSPVNSLTLVDSIPPVAPAGFSGSLAIHTLDISAPGAAARCIAMRPDIVMHLAAVVSGEAERDFDKGYRINLDGTRLLFEAIRAEHARTHYIPRVVFASSIAVFGAPFPPVIGDEFFTTPLTSYGTQKAIGELLLTDYSRHGIMDGIAIRLPTICIRPGAPNAAASGFFSNILREPLIGREAVLPVDDSVRHYHASPRAAIGFMIRAATMDLTPLGWRRTLNLPGLSATVGEQIAALRRIAGDRAVALIRREPDPAIARIVAGWPGDFEAGRARALGFAAETSFDEIIHAHIEDELGGILPAI
ncbi:D-erythronate dehydrogenase [Acidiphilium sp.]|uniref:D-erythronate dehydrogenase n=1 Tax=Acidiphilium sp. TaxID=527 RepID=UPI003D061653